MKSFPGNQNSNIRECGPWRVVWCGWKQKVFWKALGRWEWEFRQWPKMQVVSILIIDLWLLKFRILDPNSNSCSFRIIIPFGSYISPVAWLLPSPWALCIITWLLPIFFSPGTRENYVDLSSTTLGWLLGGVWSLCLALKCHLCLKPECAFSMQA